MRLDSATISVVALSLSVFHRFPSNALSTDRSNDVGVRHLNFGYTELKWGHELWSISLALSPELMP